MIEGSQHPSTSQNPARLASDSLRIVAKMEITMDPNPCLCHLNGGQATKILLGPLRGRRGEQTPVDPEWMGKSHETIMVYVKLIYKLDQIGVS